MHLWNWTQKPTDFHRKNQGPQTSWKPWKICKARWEDVLRILSYKVSSFFLKVGRGFIIRLNQPISKCTTIICSVGGSKIPFLSIKAGHTEMEFNTYRSWGSQFVEDVISWSCPPRQIQAVQIDGVQYQHKQFLLKWTPPLKKKGPKLEIHLLKTICCPLHCCFRNATLNCRTIFKKVAAYDPVHQRQPRQMSIDFFPS